MSRTALGESLHVHGEAVAQVESLYCQNAGEVTDEVEQAEAERDITGRAALEGLARYKMWVADQQLEIAKERQRLADLDLAYSKRDQWADEQIIQLAAQVAPERSKIRLGTMTVGLRHTQAVLVDPSVDLDLVPPGWIREVAARVQPATRAVDKKAARVSLVQGAQVPGITLVHRTHVKVG